MGPVTLEDIAKKTGVSKAAVAKVVLNNRSNVRVGKEKTELIRKVAEEMGYRPNAIAQALRRGKSRMIGVLIGGLNSPFFTEILEHTERIASRNGYQVLMVPVQWGTERELKALDTLCSTRVDGILVYTGLVSSQPETLRNYAGTPIIPYPGRYEIEVDFKNGMKEFFLRLRENGISELTYLDNTEVPKKKEAYLECCREFGISSDVISFDGTDEASVLTAAEEILRRNCRNLLVCSDHYAIRLVSRLGVLGKRIPDEIRIASIGGTRAGIFCCNPPLAVIDQQPEKMAETFMKMLFDFLAGGKQKQAVRIVSTFRPGESFPLGRQVKTTNKNRERTGE